MNLQITSMADIFTILLVFLLKSYASGEASIPPNPAINLPRTKLGKPPTETLRLEIGSNFVSVAGHRVLDLNDFRIKSEDDLASVREAIGKERGRQLAATGVNKAQEDLKGKLDTRVTVLVDQKVPYQTLKKLMTVAASQGYTDFKLAVVKNE